MSNEPKARMDLDPELLAAYIDKRLSPEQRAAVEEQLASDPDSYAVLANTLMTLDDETISALEVKEPLKPIPFAPKDSKSRFRTWAIAGSVLAAAAALVLVVRLDNRDSPMSEVVKASGGIRRTSGRLSADFSYAPMRAVRGSEPGALAADQWELLALVAAAEKQKPPRGSGDEHALGVAYLLLGRSDAAVDALQKAVTASDASSDARSDLAAALVERFDKSGNRADLSEAEKEVDAALVRSPLSPAALFTRALVLERLGNPTSRDGWQAYLAVDSTSGWADEARQHLRRQAQ